MNLLKNVDGEWDGPAKGFVRQDLDTIQRTINQIIQQISTLTAEAAVPPAVLSAANTPTTFHDLAGQSEFLRSVATKPGSGLTGKGTITDPLGFNGSSALISQTFTISIVQMQTLHSVPAIIVPGVPGQVIMAVSVGFHVAQSTQFSSNVNCTVRFDTIATDYTSSLALIQGGLTPGVQVDLWAWSLMPNVGGAGVINQTTLGNPPERGKGIVLRGNVDSGIGPIQPGRTQITGAIAYYLV